MAASTNDNQDPVQRRKNGHVVADRVPNGIRYGQMAECRKQSHQIATVFRIACTAQQFRAHNSANNDRKCGKVTDQLRIFSARSR